MNEIHKIWGIPLSEENRNLMDKTSGHIFSDIRLLLIAKYRAINASKFVEISRNDQFIFVEFRKFQKYGVFRNSGALFLKRVHNIADVQ